MNTQFNKLPRIIAIVPAAGTGSRMGQQIPKQYLKINHKTIIEYALQVLVACQQIDQVIVALHPEDQRFNSLPIATNEKIKVVIGGQQRADSVLAALNTIEDADWVLVHDAARPCLTATDLTYLIDQLRHSDVGGILAKPVSDTMKRSYFGQQRIAATIDRNDLWHALTPQMFPFKLLRDNLYKALKDGHPVTDEASAMEYSGFHPQLVVGSSCNIKVTHPEDLVLAEFYLQHQQ